MSISYAAVHWPDNAGEREPYHPWLYDVALIQDVLYSKANEYAEAKNYDYANRVTQTGRNMIELALAACHQAAAPHDQKINYNLSIQSHLSQGLHTARDRVNIPKRQRVEYFKDGGSDNIPEELVLLFLGVWTAFKEYTRSDIGDLKT